MMNQDQGTQRRSAMAMCPMASMCREMAEKPGIGLLLLIPGLLLILGGVLIFLEPKFLVWLLAGTSILIGLVILFFALSIRKMVTR
ncbi:MAG TPA: hypothetical protein VFR64_15320 [Methylomirabilota bacterium]|nr:hypothetical protein [Methylomirabilota bacterium]